MDALAFKNARGQQQSGVGFLFPIIGFNQNPIRNHNQFTHTTLFDYPNLARASEPQPFLLLCSSPFAIPFGGLPTTD
jgi:hypothetical protein